MSLQRRASDVMTHSHVAVTPNMLPLNSATESAGRDSTQYVADKRQPRVVHHERDGSYQPCDSTSAEACSDESSLQQFGGASRLLCSEQQYCATPIYTNALAPPKPEFKTPECLRSDDISRGCRQSDESQSLITPSGMSIDLTFGCIDNTLGRTYFSIPSPEESRDFHKQQQEMERIVARMERDINVDTSRDGE